MKKNLLKKVIEAVEATPETAFNMAVFAEKTDCGTIGCAVGSYCLRHPKAGLKFKWFQWDTNTTTADVHYRRKRGLEACALYFGISENESRFLFSPDSYLRRTKPVVLKRLRKFVGVK